MGKWVELPLSEEGMEEAIKGILEEGWCQHGWCSHEEYFITDYEAPFRVGEYQNPFELNEWAERLEDCKEDDEDVIQAIFDYAGSIEEGLDILEGGEYWVYRFCEDMTDVAWEVVKESGLLDGIPEEVARYFDYEAYGRDLESGDSSFIRVPGCKIYLEIY